MKKSLIALAVAAGTIAGAQAADTTTLYGSLAYSSVITKSDSISIKGVKNNKWDINRAVSKIGIKGTEDLDNGLQAFFKFEGTGGLGSNRYAYIGLKGDFGTLTLGQQDTLFKKVTDKGFFEEVGVTKGVPAFDGNYPGRDGNIISYVSPDMSGLKLGVSAQAQAANPSSNKADAWEIAAMYEANGLNAGLAYTAVKQRKGIAPNPQEFLGLNIGYENDQYGVNGNVRHTASYATEYTLQGQYKDGKNTFNAGVGFYDAKSGSANNVYTYALGYKYNFSNRTYTWIEAQYDDFKSKNVDDGFQALVGLRHDF